MKKIKFKSSLLKQEGVLTREQLKNVLGGNSVATTNEYAKACEGKNDGDPCFVTGKGGGHCKYGTTGPLVCWM